MPEPMDAPAAKTTLRPGIAERLWEASRIEFSLRGYHGARVQGIARRAGCNVALLYRHWTSKKALYLDLLRSVWQNLRAEVARGVAPSRGAQGIVASYIDAHMRDPAGAQILVREILDGGPFLAQLIAAEPAMMEHVRTLARAISGAPDPTQALRPGVDPTLAILSIGGLAAFVAAGHEAARPYFEAPVPPEVWRRHTYEILLHGILPCPPAGEAS